MPPACWMRPEGGDDATLARCGREGTLLCALTRRVWRHQFIDSSLLTAIDTECFLI